MVERSKCMNVPELRFKGFKQEWDFCSVGDFYYFKNGLNKGKEFFGYGTPIVNFTDVFNNRGLTSDILKGRVSLSKKEISSFEVKKRRHLLYKNLRNARRNRISKCNAR